MRNLILTLVFAASPMIASADSPKWFPRPDEPIAAGTELDGESGRGLRPGQVAYHENDDATTDSNVIHVGNCEVWTMTLKPDEDGTETGAQGKAHYCMDPDTTCANCPAIDDGASDVVLDGSTAEKKSVSSQVGRYACFEVTANTNPDEYRVSVECK